MPVDRKSTKRKTKTLADKKAAPEGTPEMLERIEKVERALVERLIEEVPGLPDTLSSILRTKLYHNLVVVGKPIEWTLVVRASMKRRKEFLEVCKELITEQP